jgi:hypothetical protein
MRSEDEVTDAKETPPADLLDCHTKARISQWLDSSSPHSSFTKHFNLPGFSNSTSSFVEAWEDPTLSEALNQPRRKGILDSLGLVCFRFRRPQHEQS